MLQILLDHLFRHLPNRRAKVPASPKMLPPIALFQMGKLLEKLARRTPLDPPHDLTRRQIRRTAHQNMHVILAHHTFHNPNFKCFARLSPQLSPPLSNLTAEHLVSVFSHPNKVILDLVDPLTAASVIPALALPPRMVALKLTG